MGAEQAKNISTLIKARAKELGFDACGIARAQAVDTTTQERINQWTDKGLHGQMDYMTRNTEKRLNPTLLVPGAQSVICVALNYHQKDYQPPGAHYKVSQYAAGRDYHFILKTKMYQLLEYIQTVAETQSARVFTDSAPVMERYWAQQAGLGATGKNTCLILPRKGSYFFLGEIILDIPLDYDPPYNKDLCGKCTHCMEACPTGAIVSPGVVDAKKCISYLTIELKDDIPGQFKGNTDNYIFGCDICQDICPHNRNFAQPTSEEDFRPLPAIARWEKQDWENMDKPAWKNAFVKTRSPVARALWPKLMQNIKNTSI